MNKYNWKGINSSSGNDLGKLKKKPPTVALNKFYATNEYSYSKHLKSWKADHYFKDSSWRMKEKLSTLLRRKTSKHDDFYSLNCFYSFWTKSKLE